MGDCRKCLGPGVRGVLAGLLLVLSGALGAMDAYPQLDHDALAQGDGSHRPIVLLPADADQALRLIHGYNAEIAAQGLTTPPGTAGYRVPSLAACFGSDGPGGRDPDRSPAVQAWAVLAADAFGRLPAPQAAALHFPLRRESTTGRLVLVVPGHSHRERLQGFIDAASHIDQPGPSRLEHEAGWENRDWSPAGLTQSLTAATVWAQPSWPGLLMIGAGVVLCWLAFAYQWQALVLVPVGIGCVLVNALGAGPTIDASPAASSVVSLLGHLRDSGLGTVLLPLLLMFGLGLRTDLSPLLARPWWLLLAAAGHLTVLGCVLLAAWLGLAPGSAGALAMVASGDGPIALFVAAQVDPDHSGAVAVAAFGALAVVALAQGPVMRLLTTTRERAVAIPVQRPVSRRGRLVVALLLLVVTALLLPAALPLLGMLVLGCLLRESGLAERVAPSAGRGLDAVVSVALGLVIGVHLHADTIVHRDTVLIAVVAVLGPVVATVIGLLLGKALCLLTGGRFNPLLAAVASTAATTSPRVADAEGHRANHRTHLLNDATGMHLVGIIGTAVAAGVVLTLFAT